MPSLDVLTFSNSSVECKQNIKSMTFQDFGKGRGNLEERDMEVRSTSSSYSCFVLSQVIRNTFPSLKTRRLGTRGQSK